MKNRKIGIIAFLLCFCFCLIPYQITALSTSDASEPIVPENECSLTVSYCYGETAFSGVSVKLYRVSNVSEDFKYNLTRGFAPSGLILNGIRSTGEWNVVRSTLEAHIVANNIAPDLTAETNADGQVSFESLNTGMYLAIVDQVEQDGLHCQFDSVLIALPGLEVDGTWQYQASANAKGELLPPIDSDDEKELKILKLWRGDEDRNSRPQSIDVEIFCDGSSYKTVTLSEENHWSYSWSVRDDTSNWTVIEQNVPSGYTMTVEKRDTSFVLTNTWTPENPDGPERPPQTGDTSNIMLYILIMIVSGGVLIVLGTAGKRSRV